MNTDSKGRAWYNKIYHKFETILVEVDNLASQSKVSHETEKRKEDRCSGNFDLEQHDSGTALEQKEGDSLKDKSSGSMLTDETLEEHTDCNQTVTTDCNQTVTTSQACQSTHRSPESLMTATAFNQDEFFIEDFDAAPLDTIDLYDMTFREDSSDFDDNLLYAARDRSRQLRSFKSKIMDALTSKRRREKEYEQLAIWFGDADMGCDLMKTKEHATIDSKSSHSIVPFASEEDSEWELL
uniref:Uncharacterized protein n=1 Tax=Noccaea caerulescens TaxID=107243 RepID=A0A1J3ERN8_NOCCA